MKYLKEVGLITMGALIAFVLIMEINLYKRVKSNEVNITQIIQFLNQQNGETQ